MVAEGTASFNYVGGKGTPSSGRNCSSHDTLPKAPGSRVGIAMSHCDDANTTLSSVLWYGGKVFEADGKAPGINSHKTAQGSSGTTSSTNDATAATRGAGAGRPSRAR